VASLLWIPKGALGIYQPLDRRIFEAARNFDETPAELNSDGSSDDDEFELVLDSKSDQWNED
jgi:hypothetical protein